MASRTNRNLITEAEAVEVLDKIDDLNGGVVPQPDGSRAYVPVYGGGYEPPVEGENKLYVADFANGKRIFLGLVYDLFVKYTSWYKDPRLVLAEIRRIVDNN